MELLIKCAALAIFSALSAMLVRRYNPELSFSLSAATAAVMLLACGSLLEKLLDGIREVEQIYGGSAPQLKPILKCLGIAATSRIGADLCRDASQSALASALETAGGLCAAAVAMPTILSVMTMIGGML